MPNSNDTPGEEEPVPPLPRDVAREISEYLEILDLLRLRQTSHRWRDNLACCFTAAAVSACSPALQADFMATFPDATTLQLECHSLQLSDGELSRVAGIADSVNALGQAAALRIHTYLWDASAMQALGTRCTSLESLALTTSTLTATFHGAGPTPAEQHTHLRRQLAAPTQSPALLYPASPLAHACLTHLTLNLTMFAHGCTHMHPTFQDARHTIATPLDPLAPCPNPTLDLLRALPHLPALTHLELIVNTDVLVFDVLTESTLYEFEYQAILATLPQLPQLVQLRITNSDSLEADNMFVTAPQYSHLAPLTRLTHLALTASMVHIDRLSHLVNLQHLEVDQRLGDVDQLHPLTALTALLLGNWEYDGEGYYQEQYTEEYEPTSLTDDLPAAWRSGLRHLAWLCTGEMEPAVLGLLTSLTCLEINDQELSSDFVGALTKMPHLQHLTTRSMRPQPGWQLAPAPLADRPVLPALQQLSCDLTLVTILACLTRLPLACKQLVLLRTDEQGHSPPAVLLQHWSPIWLETLLRAPCYRKPLVLVSQADVVTFCTAASHVAAARRASTSNATGALAPSVRLQLHVTPQVPMTAVLQLVTVAAEFAGQDAQLKGWEPFSSGEYLLESPDNNHGNQADLQYAGQPPEAGPSLFHVGLERLQGLAPGALPTLRQAQVDCREVHGAALQVLLAAAPNLKVLKLCHGGRFAASDLPVLCQHAPLRRVQFMDLTAVQAEATAVFEALLLHGCNVGLQWATAGARAASVAAVEAVGAALRGSGVQQPLRWVPRLCAELFPANE